MRRIYMTAMGCVMVLLFSSMANAHEFSIGALKIDHPWSRATPTSAAVGGAYFTITNNGTEPDTLVSAVTDASKRAEFHKMSMNGDVMKMAKVTEPLVIMPGQKLIFEPNGLHMMLFELKAGLEEGESFAGMLTFERAGSADVIFKVDRMGARAPKANVPVDNAGDATSHSGLSHDSE